MNPIKRTNTPERTRRTQKNIRNYLFQSLVNFTSSLLYYQFASFLFSQSQPYTKAKCHPRKMAIIFPPKSNFVSNINFPINTICPRVFRFIFGATLKNPLDLFNQQIQRWKMFFTKPIFSLIRRFIGIFVAHQRST